MTLAPPRALLTAFSLILTLSLLVPSVHAVPGAATAKSMIRELTERFSRSGSREGVDALTEVGGRQVVEELIEAASREGGEALVRRVHALGMRHGADAISVLRRNPKAYTEALEALPDQQVAPALWGALRQADAMDSLVTKYGAKALRAEVAHPGVGATTLARLGDDAAPLMDALATPQLARLQPALGDLARLPTPERSKVLAALRHAPGAALDALERHPKILVTTGGVVALVAVAHEALQPNLTRKTLPDGTVIEEFTSFGNQVVGSNRRHIALFGSLIAGAFALRILLPAFRRKT